MRRLAVCWLLVAAVGASSCGGNASASDQFRQGEPRSPPVTDYASLAASLRAAGASVKSGARVDQPFFPISGRLLEVHGEDVQVFQFDDAGSAKAQAARISSSGTTIGTTKVQWIGPPHFYSTDSLLVLYVGDNERVLKALETVLGRQFAGQRNRAGRLHRELEQESSHPRHRFCSLGAAAQLHGDWRCTPPRLRPVRTSLDVVDRARYSGSPAARRPRSRNSPVLDVSDKRCRGSRLDGIKLRRPLVVHSCLSG
jgi:hypothetical protein